jgi:quercetin dioxygenase-like cupin family protein
MTSTRKARVVNVAKAAKFSPDARVNEQLMATDTLMTRMNCYEPGQVTPMHMHPKEDEILYVVEGAGVVTFKDSRCEPVSVTAGDLICLPCDQYHQINAGPDGRMVLIYFMSPKYESVRPSDRPEEQAATALPGERVGA